MLPLFMTLLPRVWVQFSMAVLILPASLLALPCEQLRSLEVHGMTVTLAQQVEAGLFRPAVADSAPFRNLPAFCRVAATLRPTSDSEIRVEIWLPEPSGWNGKYEAAGNGGWGGSLTQLSRS